MGKSPPRAGALSRSSPEECGFYSPGAPATRNVYRACHLADRTVAIEAHIFHSSDEDDQYCVGLTPPKCNTSSASGPTRAFESPFNPKENSQLMATLPNVHIPSNGTLELEVTMCRRHQWWNNKDKAYPESRWVYCHKMRHWHCSFELYQDECTLHIVNGTITTESPSSPT